MWVVLLAICAIAALIIWFVTVEVRVHLRQDGWRATIDMQMKIGLIRVRRTVNIAEKIEMAVAKMLGRRRSKRKRAKRKPTKSRRQKRMPMPPVQRILGVMRGAMRYLGARTRCTRLVMAAEVGGFDAMDSALLVGAGWTAAGTTVGIFSRLMQMDHLAPQVNIVPNYAGPVCRLEWDCILRVRLGHAIVASVRLLVGLLSDRKVLAWAWASLRRRG